MISFCKRNKDSIFRVFKIIYKILNILINIALISVFIITLIIFISLALKEKFYSSIEPITDDEIVFEVSPDGKYGIVAINEEYQELLPTSISETYHNRADVLLNVFWTDFEKEKTIKYCDIPFSDFSKDYELSFVWGYDSCQLFIDDEKTHRGYEIPYQSYIEYEDLKVTYEGEVRDFERVGFRNYYNTFYVEGVQ